ncbi:hypothetical protein LI328DRAFT_105139 [Trichoderma asperelloides]|nr:hypothetical protein LI328DRAFT_105139 [Trichoderma asperelloides]
MLRNIYVCAVCLFLFHYTNGTTNYLLCALLLYSPRPAVHQHHPSINSMPMCSFVLAANHQPAPESQKFQT